MDIENTKDLRTWIEKGEVSDDIEIIIKAFSDYITAVDSEYQYNKTFLKDFIPAFIVKRALGIEILQQLKGASKFVLQTPTFSVVSNRPRVFHKDDSANEQDSGKTTGNETGKQAENNVSVPTTTGSATVQKTAGSGNASVAVVANSGGAVTAAPKTADTNSVGLWSALATGAAAVAGAVIFKKHKKED